MDGKIQEIPKDWKGRYNVKWQAKVNVNPTLANITPVRFYKRPKVEIVETALPIYNVEKTFDTFNAFVYGQSIDPPPYTRWPYDGPTTYRLVADQDWPVGLNNTIIDITNITDYFLEDGPSGTIRTDYELKPNTFSPTITQLNNARTVTIDRPYLSYPLPGVKAPVRIYPFMEGVVNLTYESGSIFTDSGISSSYVRINISDLDTFSGDVYRLKVFAKSKNDLQGYKILEDLVIESKELLEVDYYLNSINKRTGVFDSQQLINDYWEIVPLSSTGQASIDSSNSYGFLSANIIPTNTSLIDE